MSIQKTIDLVKDARRGKADRLQARRALGQLGTADLRWVAFSLGLDTAAYLGRTNLLWSLEMYVGN